jgi:beta-phosphoglucomutase-like phosphatase (HAD superfamily)
MGGGDGRVDGPVERVVAVIFDTDGVVTRTATVHAAAWKALFDEYLRRRADATGQRFVAFGDEDYVRYVDGRSRYEGVEEFLASRDIVLPPGEPDDAPDRETVCGLGNRKNEHFVAQRIKPSIQEIGGVRDRVPFLRPEIVPSISRQRILRRTLLTSTRPSRVWMWMRVIGSARRLSYATHTTAG